MRSIYDARQENFRTLIGEAFGGSQASAATALEMEQPSFISRLLSTNPDTRKNIGAKLARKIEMAAAKPLYWLDGDHRQQKLDQERAEYNVSDGPGVQHPVPLISWVQAGQWSEVVDTLGPGEAEKWIETTARVSKQSFALRIVGDSMTNPNGSPSFPEGMIIILDPGRAAEPGKYVVVRQNHDSECTFKQLIRDSGRFFLKPLNPRYPIMEMGTDAVICGVLVQAVMDF